MVLCYSDAAESTAVRPNRPFAVRRTQEKLDDKVALPMQQQYVFLTHFIMENGDEENAYRTYRERVQALAALDGVDVVSASKALRQVDKGSVWESLAEQYQIEHGGAYPENHVLCKVATVVGLEEAADFGRAAESLIMDDRNVRVDRYPSRAEAIEQILL